MEIVQYKPKSKAESIRVQGLLVGLGLAYTEKEQVITVEVAPKMAVAPDRACSNSSPLFTSKLIELAGVSSSYAESAWFTLDDSARKRPVQAAINFARLYLS